MLVFSHFFDLPKGEPSHYELLLGMGAQLYVLECVHHARLCVYHASPVHAKQQSSSTPSVGFCMRVPI